MMALPRRYEIKLFDRALVEFTASDGPFSTEIALDDFDKCCPTAEFGALMRSPHARFRRRQLAHVAFVACGE